jgi:hypothetical protein
MHYNKGMAEFFSATGKSGEFGLPDYQSAGFFINCERMSFSADPI